MKAVLAASPALLLAGAMFAAPASAQTMAPDMNQLMASPYAGTAGSQPYAAQGAVQPYTGQAMSIQQTVGGPLP